MLVQKVGNSDIEPQIFIEMFRKEMSSSEGFIQKLCEETFNSDQMKKMFFIQNDEGENVLFAGLKVFMHEAKSWSDVKSLFDRFLNYFDLETVKKLLCETRNDGISILSLLPLLQEAYETFSDFFDKNFNGNYNSEINLFFSRFSLNFPLNSNQE